VARFPDWRTCHFDELFAVAGALKYSGIASHSPASLWVNSIVTVAVAMAHLAPQCEEDRSTAVCIGDLIEGDPLGSARPDGAACQKSEQLLQILPECSSILASDDL
jgi:hypothetical protein